jgi:hypothetical protein
MISRIAGEISLAMASSFGYFVAWFSDEFVGRWHAFHQRHEQAGAYNP